MKNGALDENVNPVCPVSPLAFVFSATGENRERGKEIEAGRKERWREDEGEREGKGGWAE